MDNSTVKIDIDLLKNVKNLLRQKSKKIRYSSARQFVNIAVLELLEKEKGDEKDE